MSASDPLAWLVNLSGEAIVAFILFLAGWLTGEGTPGWVALGLVGALVALVLWYEIITWRFNRAVKAVMKCLAIESDGKITTDRLSDIDQRIEDVCSRGGVNKRLGNAWLEFKETALKPANDTDVLRNTVRPAVFFNREELGVESGLWRQLPTLFVSIGLLLTFLGLVAALEQTSQVLGNAADTNATVRGLTTLLSIASAKFIMSLTGLACSIVFTVELKYSTKRKDRALHELCKAIENGCDYMSEQDVLRSMLQEAKKQTTHFQTFGTELVAQIARPLKEDLPDALRESVEKALLPVAETISNSTNKGIEALVKKVSDQLVGGIEDSVAEINNVMNTVCTKLDEAASRLEQSSGVIIATVEEAVGSLEAGINRLSSSVDNSTASLGEYSESIKENTGIVTSSSQQLLQSYETLVEASEPLRDTISTLRNSIQLMRETSEHATSILRRTDKVFEDSQTFVQEGLNALEGSFAEFKGAIDRYAQIDRHIGDTIKETTVHIDFVMNTVCTKLIEATGQLERSSRTIVARFDHAIGSLDAGIGRLSGGIDDSTASLGEYADAIQQNTGHVALSSQQLRLSSESLVAASGPIHESVSTLQFSIQAMRETSEHTLSILRRTDRVFENSQTFVREGLNALEGSFAEFKVAIDRYAEIDHHIGNIINDSTVKIDNVMNTVCTKLIDSAGQLEHSSRTVATTVEHAVESLDAGTGRLAGGIDESTASLGKYAKSLQENAGHVAFSSRELVRSSEVLAQTSKPISDTIVDLQSSTREMRETSQNTAKVIRHTLEVFESSHSVVQDGLRALEISVTEFGEVASRYREIDEQLGDAFKRIETDVRGSINEIGEFERKVNTEFARALNQLEAVIAQAEPFKPRSEE